MITTTHTILSHYQSTCDFEHNNLCSWKNDQSYYPWRVTDSDTLIENKLISKFAPKTDHTINTSRGHFAYLSHEEDDTNLLRISVLSLDYSEVEGSDGSLCLTLWYHMRTADDVQLNVTVSAPNDSYQTITTRRHDQGYQWNKLQVESLVKKGYQLRISALAKLGIVAIDDISLKRGAC